jgi:hypothetical protein
MGVLLYLYGSPHPVGMKLVYFGCGQTIVSFPLQLINPSTRFFPVRDLSAWLMLLGIAFYP